ncbi:MAG TPA: phosphatase PAP2 family protein [Rhizomicrobium sp.]
MVLELQRRLFALAGLLVLIDLVWWPLGHFQVDAPAYARLALMSLALLAGGIFYQTRRREPELAAMLMGASFLCLFSAAASVLNYFLITVAGTRHIDDILVATDRALGFDWYAAMVWMSHHVWLNEIFFRIYNVVLPEIALVMVALAWTGQAEKVYRYCLAVAAGALIAIAVWTLAPSLGAKSLYTLPPDVAGRLTLSVTCQYGRELIALLKNGPGFITPADMRGLIAFPSYHGVLALIVAWYGWQVRWLRWPLLLLNAAIVIASPIQGGHHMIDLLGSFPVAALALFAAGEWRGAQLRVKPSGVVKKRSLFAPSPIPKGLFRITAAQKRAETRSSIKSKLSGVS